MELFAEVIVNNDAIDIDKPFTYKVKEKDIDDIRIGHRVKVPFGIKSKQVEGFVLGLKCDGEYDLKRIKEVAKICDKEPILTLDDIKLIEFMRSKYLCKYIDVIRTIIPSGLMSGNDNKTKKVIVFNKPLDGKLLEKRSYVDIMNFVRDNSGIYTKTELINNHNISQYMLNKLVSEEYLLSKDTIVYRYNDREYLKDNTKELNEEQRNAVDKILNSNEKGFLLKGVTGSGKTEVYMHLVSEMLKQGRSSIILVPEIALTPQMIERFKGRFGKNVALFHSKLSKGERFDEWFRVKNNEAKLIVGARSAIFLPANDLGLIVIDEEHENTYKSEQNPKYKTQEVAEFLSKIKDCKYVLGSATPSIETYYNALNNKIQLIEMKNRVNNKKLPDIKIVDMREELKARNLSLLSRELKEQISENLKNKEQTILFLNRRGFSTFVSCRSCGYVFKCPECDVAMTYHKNGYLVCHYCGRAMKQTKICPKCKSKYVKFFGAGTERVEMEVKKNFPKARVLRMDVDTTRKKDSHEKIYNAFKNQEADILIGTQMVSKGLDFENVTLVGVLAADISLNIPDYRSGERTFQIITQVSGRAGRGEKKGRVIVQSYTPDSYVLKYTLTNDYESLYADEIKVRKLMNYPPFCKIFLINGLSKDEQKLKIFMEEASKVVKEIIKDENIEMLGPNPCIVSKIKENYRYQIILKGNFNEKLRKKIKDSLYELNKSVYNGIRISIDINPNNMA